MKPTHWIDQIAVKHDRCSDYRVAQILGISKQAVSRYRKGESAALDDAVAYRVEKELQLPLGSVIADQRAEREKDPEMRAVWERLGKLMTDAGRGAAVGVVVTFCLAASLLISAPNQAHAGNDQIRHTAYYTRLRLALRRLLARLRSSFARSCIPCHWMTTTPSI